MPITCCPAPAAPVASGLITSVVSLIFSLLKWLNCFTQCFSWEFSQVFLLFLPGFHVQLALLTTSCSPGTRSRPRDQWAEAPPQHLLSACKRLFLCLPFSYREGGSAEGELPFGICYFIRINSQVGCYFPFQLREVVVAAF